MVRITKKVISKDTKKDTKKSQPAMKKVKSALQTVICKKAPQPIGPYRLGKTVSTTKASSGTWLFTSGQIGMLPDATLISDTDVVLQAQQALKNLKDVAEAGGFDLAKDTVKTTVYLVKMADFPLINVEYAKFFTGENPPPRSCVAVHQLPKMSMFEIDAVLYKN